MAVRNIRTGNAPVLREKSSEIKEINPQVINLLEDMAETMYHSDGVGLAAVQVGIPKKLVVIDIQDGKLLELINPKIIKSEGQEVDVEACLSIPGIMGEVPRAKKVTVEALNREGQKFIVEGEDFLARVLQHEIDHLEGVLFIDRAVRFLDRDED
ncbi:MAG: peptide deformylase [Firmicutes bacterium HGW-Firmicutes-13]|nr:MAG: peptide deformylase [Firmicutes bacterium HGW-Firmicutes-13]